jgi:hypothetical protein
VKTGADVAAQIVEESNHVFVPSYYHNAGLVRFRELVRNGRSLDEALVIIDADHPLDGEFRTWLVKNAPAETLHG